MGILDALVGVGQVAVDAGAAYGNYKLGVQTNKQNMALQEEQWMREDTAMQRKVKDLTAAGLNPVLAAGGGGSPSSLAVRMTAPEIQAPDFASRYLAAKLKSQQAALNQAAIDTAHAQSMIKDNEWSASDAQLSAIKAEAAFKNAEWTKMGQNVGSIVDSNLRILQADVEKAVSDAAYSKRSAELLNSYGDIESIMGLVRSAAGTIGGVGSTGEIANRLLDRAGLPLRRRR